MKRPAILLALLLAGPVVGADAPLSGGAAWAPEPGIVWRLSSDGDWLAAVPASAGVPPGRTRDGSFVAAGAGIAARPPMPWCRDVRGVLAVGALALECAAELVDAELAQGPAPMRQAQLGIVAPLWQFGLHYESALAAPLAGVLPSAAFVEPGAGLALAPNGDHSEQALQLIGVGGSWQLAPLTRLTLGASASESTWRPARGGRVDIESIALQFGIDHGSFSGGLVGRMLRPSPLRGQGAGEVWGGLDLGVSWRAPWRAEISVGAQNLIGTRSEPGPAQPVLDQITARTPYVRYTQDL